MNRSALVLMGIAALLVGVLACQECGLWSVLAGVGLLVPGFILLVARQGRK